MAWPRGQGDATIIAAATRLDELLGQPGAWLLAPLVLGEILIRLLLSPGITRYGCFSVDGC